MLSKFCLVYTAISTTLVVAQNAASAEATNKTCLGDDIYCGSSFFGTCCPGEWRCNYRRGIPICQDPTTRYVNGFNDQVCSIGNPYLFSCDIIGIPGFCCPIPGLAPLDSSVGRVSFTPRDAWTPVSLGESELNSTCGGALSPYRRATSVFNATVSFNYTGPSILVRAIPSRTGGRFSVIIDGYNTTTFLDTYDPEAEDGRPGNLSDKCYRVRQYPPMAIVPVGYETRESHTVSLVYAGAGENLLGTDPRNLSVQFDSFALPIFSEAQMSSAQRKYGEGVVNSLVLAFGFAAWLPTLIKCSDMFLTGLCQWTRFIHCLGLKHSDKEINLEALKKLQILRLDENLVGRDLNSTTAGLINTFVNPPAHLSEVHVNGIAQPNPSVISALQRFSDLRILRLRQTRTWCDLCNLGCLLALAAPLPKSIVYENGAGLSIHYMKALSSLERLEFVSITVNVFEDSEVRLGDSEDWNPFAWSGECDDCMHTVLASPEFRTHWVALKTGQEQEIEGFGGRKYRFHKIPNLKRVEWHFADGEVVDVDSDYEEEDEEDEEGLDEISPEL
ncbi:hypothetical protein MD484_g1038, partial [Candolleomyces efflorescens]